LQSVETSDIVYAVENIGGLHWLQICVVNVLV
jgi:hypothetical protein